MLALLLAACEIQGGVAPPQTPGVLPTAELPTATPTAEPTPEPAASPGAAPTEQREPTPTVAASGSALRIGLLHEPADLMPYHSDTADARNTGPVSELLFPSPILPISYTYTATNVLERLPSFANGDIELREVSVYLDETGAITTTTTDTLTDAEQIAITYRWNPALRWSDGVTVTASDSLFAYELAQETWLGEEAEKRLRLLEDYQQLDEHTTLALFKPDLPDVNRVLTPSGEPDLNNSEYMLSLWTPLPRHLLHSHTSLTQTFALTRTAFSDSDYAAQPLGYGPYMLERRDGDIIRLQRNPYYTSTETLEADVVSFVFFDDFAALLDALQSYSIDVALADQVSPEHLALLEEQDAESVLNVHYIPNPIWEHLDFNLTFGFLRDVRTRQAIAHGINRQDMVDVLFHGHMPVLDSWMLPGHWAAAPADQLTRYPYDPERARALLDEAGVIDMNEDGIREQGIDHDSDGTLESSSSITLTLLTTAGTPLRTQIAERIQSDLAAIGLATTIATTDTRQLFSPDGPLFRRSFELSQFAWIANPDPRGFELWGCGAIPSQSNNWSGSNLAGWCDREANQAIISATTSLDLQTRRAAYIQQQQRFSEELPVLPLFQRLTLVLHYPGLRGVRPDPIAPITWNIAEWNRE